MRYFKYEPFANGVGTVLGWYSGAVPEGQVGLIESEAPDPPKMSYPNLEAVMRIDLNTGELYYDYTSKESMERTINNLISENIRLQESVLNLYDLLGGGL